MVERINYIDRFNSTDPLNIIEYKDLRPAVFKILVDRLQRDRQAVLERLKFKDVDTSNSVDFGDGILQTLIELFPNLPPGKHFLKDLLGGELKSFTTTRVNKRIDFLKSLDYEKTSSKYILATVLYQNLGWHISYLVKDLLSSEADDRKVVKNINEGLSGNFALEQRANIDNFEIKYQGLGTMLSMYRLVLLELEDAIKENSFSYKQMQFIYDIAYLRTDTPPYLGAELRNKCEQFLAEGDFSCAIQCLQASILLNGNRSGIRSIREQDYIGCTYDDFEEIRRTVFPNNFNTYQLDAALEQVSTNKTLKEKRNSFLDINTNE